MKGFDKLVGKKVAVYKAGEDGKATDEVLLEGNFQGVVRDIASLGSFITSYDVAAVFTGKELVKVPFEKLHFK